MAPARLRVRSPESTRATSGGSAAVGGASLQGELPLGWSGEATDAPRASVGVGLGLFWNVVHIEMGRGLSVGGEWEFNVFASKRFWPVL